MASDLEELQRQKLLQDIEKAKLETEKARRDLATYDQRLEIDLKRVAIDKNRFKWETVRLLGIAIVTGLLSFFTTWTIKKNEITESRRTSHYQNYYEAKKEIAKLTDDLEKCSRFCGLKPEFIQFHVPEIDRDTLYLDSMCKVRDRLLANQKKENELDQHIQTSAKPDEVVLKGIDNLENKKKNLEESIANNTATAQNRSEMNKIDASIDSLIKTAGIASVSRQSEQITNDYVQNSKEIKNISQVISNNSNEKKMAEGYPRTSWFKEGYFLVFDNMKITLEELFVRDEALTVSVCNSTTVKKCTDKEMLVKPKTISKGKPITFSVDNFEYVIQLDHIGKAGNNPFTKAAYITIEKYSK